MINNWRRQVCAMVMVLLIALSMIPSVADDAMADPIEVITTENVEVPVASEEYDLAAPGLQIEAEEPVPELFTVSAADAVIEVEDDAPKSAVPAKAKTVKGVPTELQLGVKETYALKTGKLGKKLTFSSSKTKVATVNKKGVITAKAKGKTTITCYSNKKKVTTCKVTVVAAPSKVTLDKSKATIGVNESLALKATITKGSQATLTWSSKNKKIATVSDAGKVTGKKAGKTVITVKTQNGKKASVTVTVKNAPKSVKLSNTKLTLEIGKKKTLKATLPGNTASLKKTWTSSNKKVATVNEKGVVEAIAPGTAKITVTTFNKKKATCKVTVKAKENPLTKDYVIKKGVITGYTGKGGSIEIPSEDNDGNPITAIGASAFKNNTAITEVTIPESVKKISESAFEGCAKLEKVTIPNGVTTIGKAAFKNCKKLSSMKNY